jgi:uncharacterized membrane protein YgdD (TMEM256/DUF423 family)
MLRKRRKSCRVWSMQSFFGQTASMMNIQRRSELWLVAGALLGGLAVALGAFGAHGLEGMLEGPDGALSADGQKQLANWETAARYQMYHALALLAVGILARQRCSTAIHIAGAAMTAGVFIFSGCLYALVLSEQRVLGAVVPIGGVLLLVGWAFLAYAAVNQFGSREN